MKNGWNKKILIVFCVMALTFLTGFAIWETVPKLINANKPFVELKGSIGLSIGNAQKAYEKAQLTPVPTEALVPTTTPAPTEMPEINEPDSSEVWIRIGDEDYAGSGETVTLVYGQGDVTYHRNITSSDDFEHFLKDGTFDSFKLVLFDDYAEREAYWKIKGVLDKLGYEYTTKSVD